ncbi:hypothetical protein GEMRC1_002926 [Eukaryota sp. GEM-RC1]
MSSLYILLLIWSIPLVLAKKDPLYTHLPPYKNNKFPAPFTSADFDRFPMHPLPSTKPPKVKHQQLSLQTASSGDYVIANVLTVENPIDSIRILPPPGGCGTLSSVLESNKFYNCSHGFNGGFFDMVQGFCIGYLVSNSRFVNSQGTGNSLFGLTSDNHFVSGYLDDPTIKKDGITWLVRKGEVYIEESIAKEKPSSSFVNLIAPRVAVGHDIDGRLIMVAVDGFEPLKYGIDLYDFAILCKDLGMVSSVNLDGGGSLSAIINSRIRNSCSDGCTEEKNELCPIPFGGSKCLRKVSSFVCIG